MKKFKLQEEKPKSTLKKIVEIVITLLSALMPFLKLKK